MNLYLIQRPEGETGWDEAAGFVVAAPDEATARTLVVPHCGDEPVSTWEDSQLSPCHLIGTAVPGTSPAVILRDFRAA